MNYKKFNMRSTISYTDDEKLLFNNKIFNPSYSRKQSLKLFNKVLKKILANNKQKKKFFIKNYNILSIALEDFYWQYCFQYTKYQKFINKNGLDLNVVKNTGINNYTIDGYGRVKEYIGGNVTFLNILKFFIKKCYFFIWILLNTPFNKGKVWIDRRFQTDFRYKDLKKFGSKSLVLPYSLQSIRNKNSNVEEALICDAVSKTKNFKKWMLAIKILKPSKILVTDNLYDNFSLLLAAKLSNTRCEAICHSPTIRNHMNIFGTKLIRRNETLKFDKLFVYHKIFKEFIIKYGSFYNKNEIDIVKWPNTKKYNFKIKKNNRNIYILYPFEHFCNFKKINKFLLFFKKKNHKIVVKTRPDMKNYNHFDESLDIEFVDDFKKNHFANCFCIIGSTTGLLFNCAQNYIPIVYVDDNGYDHFRGLNFPKNWLNCKTINKKIYKKIKSFSKPRSFQLIS